MHKLFYTFIFIALTFTLLFNVSPAIAEAPAVVISRVQFGDLTSLSYEFVELYNNSDVEIDVTNWCVYYASALSDSIGSKMACVTTENPNIHIFLPARGSLLAVSSLLSTNSGLNGDIKFSATLSKTAGHVRLLDNKNQEIDKVAWGDTAISPEGKLSASVPIVGEIISRKSVSETILQDTNVNFDDFENVLPPSVFKYGLIYEVQDLCSNIDNIQTVLPDGYSVDVNSKCSPPPIDVCSNLNGIQVTTPHGYELDSEGKCQSDVCVNIAGLQTIIPNNLESDGFGNCVIHDECLNLPEIQPTIAQNYIRVGEGDCRLNLLPIVISELLPNPVGTDDGNEFFEIYNPNDNDVLLDNYLFVIGSDSKSYNFPAGAVVSAKSYRAFSSSDINFNLVNSVGVVKIFSIDNYLIDAGTSYVDAGDGVSWSLIDNLWQYSNRLTPNAANLPSIIEQEIEIENVLIACAANQYRSPETNRCRIIPTAKTVLAACKDGQYRSEETGRCRNIISDVASLTICAEGQERNPATNRCRNISGTVLGASNIKPCKAGQERNPETNRCRNIVSVIATADYAPTQVNQSEGNGVVALSFVGAGTLAVSYGVWEWRTEIVKFILKIRRKFSK